MAQNNQQPRGGSFRRDTTPKKRGTISKFISRMHPFVIFSFFFFLFCVIVVIAAYIGNVYLESQVDQAQQEINNINSELNTDPQQSQRTEILSLPARVEAAQGLFDQHIYPSRLYNFLRENTLTDIYFNSVNFSINEEDLFLEGVAQSFDSFAQQMAQFDLYIGDSPDAIANGLQISNLTLTDKGISFSIELSINPSYFKSN